MKVPLLLPLLPSADDLLPYLRRIDQNRIYSNWGPLVAELSERIASFFNVSAERIVTASSGTAALVGAILATAGRANAHRNVAVTQAMTFVATLSAMEQCGYTARIMDVKRDTWSLDPEAVRNRTDLDEVGVVVPVAAYGRPIEIRSWEQFSRNTGIPVVIDAAACFDTLGTSLERYVGAIPLALSFHATKVFSTGEGGCVICADGQVAERVTAALNFGFFVDRNSRVPSINGKMNEYSAAMGLCSLDRWSAIARSRRAILDFYSEVFTGLPGCRIVLWPRISSTYVLLLCEEASPDFVIAQLQQNAIDYRLWYGSGLHLQTYVQRMAGQGRLAVTEDLCCRLIGMPVVDFSDEQHTQLRRFSHVISTSYRGQI